MEISIRQENMGRDRYTILVDGKVVCFGSLATRKFRKYIDILSPQGAVPYIRIEVEFWFRWFKQRNTIRIGKERKLPFSISLFDYTCEIQDGADAYRVLHQKHLRANIYLNGSQVGLLQRNSLSFWRDKDKYTLMANHDADTQVLIAIALIWDKIIYYDDGPAIDLKQLKGSAPDPEWKPREKDS